MVDGVVPSRPLLDTIIVDHSYALGMAWDKGRFRNHGALYETQSGNGFFRGSLSFAPGRNSPGSAVVIPPSKSLEDIGAVKVRSLVFTTGVGGGARRQNIEEGNLSFAFFINPDLYLQGTFLNSANQWV